MVLLGRPVWLAPHHLLDQAATSCILRADLDHDLGVAIESINGNMTWWDQSQGFLSYLARCQFPLQQGLPVADACYFFGEGSCKFVPARELLQPPLPDGCEFDGINAEVIAERLSVEKGLLALPKGLSYWKSSWSTSG